MPMPDEGADGSNHAVVVDLELGAAVGAAQADAARCGLGAGGPRSKGLAHELYHLGRATRELGRSTVVDVDDREHVGPLLELERELLERLVELTVGEDTGP